MARAPLRRRPLSSSPMPSRRDELVPLLHHVAVLIHHRVPAGDGGSFYDRMGAVACWNAVMDEDRYMVQKWNSFIAA